MFDIFFGNFKHFLGNLSLLTKISLQLYRFEVITCQTFVLSKIYLVEQLSLRTYVKSMKFEPVTVEILAF
jgi:hypothetical protein